MTQTVGRIEFAGTDLILDPSGALYRPEGRELVVADLHFEKGQSIGLRTRRPIPPYDTAETLRKLAEVVTTYDPATIVCLGDSFHDAKSMDRFAVSGREIIDALSARRTWIWVRGNHDPEIPIHMGGEIVTEYRSGNLSFRHDEIGDSGDAVVLGHFHPIALTIMAGRIWRRRCFIFSRAVLVMPSFGSYTGGLNILHPAITQIIGNDFKVWILGSAGVYPVSRVKLQRDMPIGHSP